MKGTARTAALVTGALGVMGMLGACPVLAWAQWAPCSGSARLTPATAAWHGRLADAHISYLTLGPYVCRWRLVRRDPRAAVADVVDPVVYVIDTTVPQAIRPYFARGVEAWLPVFAELGFRHALTVRVGAFPGAGVPREHVVTLRLAQGGGGGTQCIADAATGELARCDVYIGDTYTTSVEDRGHLLCLFWTASDPHASLPCADSTMGRFVEGVVMHEVGHTLGLDHNWSGGQAYPTDSLRNAAFVHRWGFTPTVMDYVSYDDVTPPGNGMTAGDRWLRIGAYDRWAIAWAYRPIPGAATPAAELPTLRQWLHAQDTAAYLRIPGGAAGNGRVQSEDAKTLLTGADPLAALRLWEQNAARAVRRVRGLVDSLDGRGAPVISAVQRDGVDSLAVMEWHTRLGALVELLGDTASGPRQLAILRTVLAAALYGHDPLLETQARARPQTRAAMTPVVGDDSLPFLFNVVAPDRSTAIVQWYQARQDVVMQLAGRVAQLTPAVRPVACRDLDVAVRALARADTVITGPGIAPQLQGLRTALDGARHNPQICPGG